MKKLLLFTMGAAMAMPVLAQEEDVTSLIANPGFDEDLTFQLDGSMKEMVEQQSLSDRSWAFIAADKTVYARPKDTSSQKRPDGRKMEAVNGFKGQVSGWTLESNAKFPQCEWTYFGTVPYDLASQSVPIADDGSTYLEVPARPTEFDGGVGFVYLRAGWTNSAIYKQEVNLPCAVYRLEYWTININPNTTAVAADLTQITCRKDVFKDEEGTGLQSQVWTKHEFEFTPTSTFTMQFGYQAANAGSGGQPIVALDGIKLYKIGEADPHELLMADLGDLQSDFEELAVEALNAGLNGLAGEIYDEASEIDGVIGDTDEVMSQAFKDYTAKLETYKKAIEAAATLDEAIAKMETLIATTDYAGKAEFQEAFDRILGYKDNGTAEQILGAADEADAAIRAYVMSQAASQDSPADYTFFINAPKFVKGDADYLEDNSENRTSDGWYIGETGGDQRLNFAQGRSCWNAWKQGIGTISISQDLTDMPNGYYRVTADMITQQDYANQTQHVFGKTSVNTAESDPLTVGNWNDEGTGEWTTLTTRLALVTDGKLTIGAEGSGNGATDQSGWFCVTNFKLEYLGEAGDDAVQGLLTEMQMDCQNYLDGMHFQADKAALQAAINAGGDPAEALKALNEAYNTAKLSEAKWAELMGDGKTLPTVEAELAGAGYQAATDIVRFAYDQTMAWMNGPEGTYTEADNKLNLLKNYLNTYAPAYNEAAELAATATGTGKTALEEVMAAQKAQLTSEMQTAEVVNQLVAELQTAMVNIQKQVIWETQGETVYTPFIMNAMLQSEAGWTFNKGNGNNNTGVGQWFTGDASVRYIDSYNSAGLADYTAEQEVTALPNGNYTLSVYTRAPAEGAYIFYASEAAAAARGQLKVTAANTTFVEIPLNYYIDAEGVEQVASDNHGPVWEEAEAAFNAGSTDEEVLAIYNANNGIGRGWKRQEFSVDVTNHMLLIGAATGSEALGTEKVFAGAWFSAGGWELKLNTLGNNDGWGGPLADGIESVVANQQTANGIYNLNGMKMQQMQRGLNIIMNNGKATKLMVK